MSGFFPFCRKSFFVIAPICIAVLLNSCQLAKNQLTYDRESNLDRQSYRDAFLPPASAASKPVPIPDFQPILSTPADLKLPTPLVTVSVNQTVALRDLLFELAEQADVDLELDPQIHGSIIFTAKERPFDEVINRICQMAGLRYKFNHNVLRVELDRPYLKTYNIDYVNVTRAGKSSINTKVSVGSGDSGGGGSESSGGSGSLALSGSSSGGSESSITNSYEGDLWKELDDGIKHLLTATDTDVMLATLSDPVTVPVNPNPPPLPTGSTDPNASAQTTPPPLPGAPEVNAMPATVAPTLNVTPTSEPVLPNPNATYTISRQSGIVSVFASERQQRQVQNYLNEFRRRATTQVLIEAKIFEVDLSDEYAAGIDWGTFNLTGLARLTPKFAAPGLNPTTTDAFTAILEPRDNLRITAEALSRFGSVRTLSSPRVTALNNQPAIVNVARNIIFFTITNGATTTSTSSGSTTTGGIQTEPQTVPEGVLLNVVPLANPETGEILLNIRPTVTRLLTFVNDPAPQLIDPTSTVESKIPEMQTQELESLLRLQSGQTIVMGGLMQDSSTVTETGIPVAGDIPFLGALFRNHGDQIKKSELVIFLKASIISGPNADETDRTLYETMSLDRHPTKL